MAGEVRVALLEADHVDPALRPIAGDYADMFARSFTARAPELAFERVDVVGGEPLPTPGAHDAVLVTGSRHGVGDGLAWVEELSAYVRGAVDREVPVVGICFGHQLIAHALGGEVARAGNGWGVGGHDTSVHAVRSWMLPSVERFRLLMSHQDQVVELPDDAAVVAATDHAPIAAFEVGSAVGFQGHPEFVPAYLDALLAGRIERIGAERVAQARASLAEPTDHELVTDWLAGVLAGPARH